MMSSVLDKVLETVLKGGPEVGEIDVLKIGFEHCLLVGGS